MPIVQNYERPLMKDKDHTKIGQGVFLNPYSGGLYTHPYYKHNKAPIAGYTGDGFNFASLGNFFKNNIGAIADAETVAYNIAYIVQTAKEIKRDDEELYELKRIKDEMARNSSSKIFTKSQHEVMDKIRKSGGGIKVI